MAITVYSGFAYGANQISISSGAGLGSPSVSSATAVDHKTVRITFSEALLTSAGDKQPGNVLDPQAYELVADVAPSDPLAIIHVAQVTTAIYDLTVEQLDEVDYTLTAATSMRSTFGQALNGAANTAGFTGVKPDYGPTPGNLYTFFGTNIGLQDQEQAAGWQPSQAFEFVSNEMVTAVDTLPQESADELTRRYLPPYEPVIDLNMVEARLTNRARYYISRGMHDGTSLYPTRFVLGTGWESPRWGEPPKPSPDTTEVTAEVYEGDVVLEEANPKPLVIRCEGPEAPSYGVQEVMVYAIIRNSPVTGESFKEIPFACAVFPAWFHTAGQQFVARLVIPM